MTLFIRKKGMLSQKNPGSCSLDGKCVRNTRLWKEIASNPWDDVPLIGLSRSFSWRSCPGMRLRCTACRIMDDLRYWTRIGANGGLMQSARSNDLPFARLCHLHDAPDIFDCRSLSLRWRPVTHHAVLRMWEGIRRKQLRSPESLIYNCSFL